MANFNTVLKNNKNNLLIKNWTLITSQFKPLGLDRFPGWYQSYKSFTNLLLFGRKQIKQNLLTFIIEFCSALILFCHQVKQNSSAIKILKYIFNRTTSCFKFSVSNLVSQFIILWYVNCMKAAVGSIEWTDHTQNKILCLSAALSHSNQLSDQTQTEAAASCLMKLAVHSVSFDTISVPLRDHCDSN